VRGPTALGPFPPPADSAATMPSARPADDAAEAAAALGNLHIAVGGYDATVVGMHMTTDPADGLLSLEARFAYAPHASSVRALALHGPTLASASSDETVRLYDVSAGTELAALTHHSGSVNCLAMCTDPESRRALVLAGSDDATISVTRDGDWRLLKKLTGHTAPVTAVAVHPTARVALTLASDRSLFMWNLLRGKVAFSAKTKPGPATSVCWSPDGERYMLAAGNLAAVYTADGQLDGTFEHDGAVLSAAFLGDRRVVTGGEDKTVRVWDTRGMAGRCVATTAVHEMRVRAVGVATGAVVSADTGGGVKVWDEARGELRIETEVGGGGMRLTCMAVGGEVAPQVPRAAGDDGGGALVKARQGKGRRAEADRRRPGSTLEVADGPKVGTASTRKRRKRKEGGK
jgi:protein MAK11